MGPITNLLCGHSKDSNREMYTAVDQQGSELSSEEFHLHSLIFLLKLQITEIMIMG